MSAITLVSVSVGYTHNLGNYESLRLDVTESRRVDEGDSVEEVYKGCWDSATEQLYQQFLTFQNRMAGGDGNGGVAFMRVGE